MRAAEDVSACTVQRTVIPTRELLFRYSAVTFNSHRIHYDREYAVNTEGYPDLVVQGPLLVTLLAGLVVELLERPPHTFQFRAKAPTFVDQQVRLTASVTTDDRISLRAETVRRGR